MLQQVCRFGKAVKPRNRSTNTCRAIDSVKHRFASYLLLTLGLTNHSNIAHTSHTPPSVVSYSLFIESRAEMDGVGDMAVVLLLGEAQGWAGLEFGVVSSIR